MPECTALHSVLYHASAIPLHIFGYASMSDVPLSLRSPRVYAAVVAATLLTAVLSFTGAISLGSVAFIVLMVLVALTGIPHGAVDHVVAADLYGLTSSWSDQAKFYGVYLALMAAYGVFWLISPVASLALFLGLTVYHFGQADLAYWDVPAPGHVLLYASRGVLLIGLPIVAFPELVDPIFVAIADVQVSAWPGVTTAPTALLSALVAQHAVVLLLMQRWGTPAWSDVGRELFNTAVLAALLITAHPLVGFAVYFGLWHSLGHILEILRFFQRHGRQATLGHFYRKAALFTLISFSGLGGLYLVNEAFGAQEQMIALLFILISVLTLPHMLIVEAMYQRQRPAGPRPETAPAAR